MENSTIVVLSVALIGICSCFKENAISNKKINSALVLRSTLSEILANGVASKNDFDVLRSNGIYPFDTLSDPLFAQDMDSTTFDDITFVRDRFGLHSYLTESQYKIWFQVATHSNIDIDYSGSSAFLNDVTGEMQYGDKSGYPSSLVIPENKAVIVQDLKDCPIGVGGCVAPF